MRPPILNCLYKVSNLSFLLLMNSPLFNTTAASSAVSSSSDSTRDITGLGGLVVAVVGGGDVATGAGAGEGVVEAGVTEQEVDGLRLAVPVDGDWLADGGLNVGEGGPLHSVTGGGRKSCSLWPACTAASTLAVNQVLAVGCVGLGVGGETH